MKAGVSALTVVFVLGSVPSTLAQAASESGGAWKAVRATTPAGASETADDTKGFWWQTGDGLKTIWTRGGADVFVPGYIWHLPWQYSDDQLARYNTTAWGVGYGRTLSSRRHRPRTLYGIVSADSFSRPQYMAGYAWQARWRPGGGAFSLSGGYTAMVIGRYDKFRYAPLPVALPLGSIGVDRFELMGAYVPGYDVMYVFLKVGVGTDRGTGASSLSPLCTGCGRK